MGGAAAVSFWRWQPWCRCGIPYTHNTFTPHPPPNTHTHARVHTTSPHPFPTFPLLCTAPVAGSGTRTSPSRTQSRRQSAAQGIRLRICGDAGMPTAMPMPTTSHHGNCTRSGHNPTNPDDPFPLQLNSVLGPGKQIRRHHLTHRRPYEYPSPPSAAQKRAALSPTCV